MARTPWLLGTLLYATLLILLIMGPIEVLLPFAVKDQTGGGAGAFALAIGAFGIGGAVGSLLVASLPLPRRYLTLMVLLWGVGSAPLVVIGLTDRLAVMVVALFVVGIAWAAAQVIWGTLLQRRVPPAMLGRVSSLDFFVSLALMPVSMALAGPVGERIGLAPAFLVAGAVPTRARGDHGVRGPDAPGRDRAPAGHRLGRAGRYDAMTVLLAHGAVSKPPVKWAVAASRIPRAAAWRTRRPRSAPGPPGRSARRADQAGRG